MNDSINFESKILPEIIDIVDALILVLDKEGRIVLFNKASETATRYSFSEVEGKTPWNVFILADEIEGVRRVFSQLTAGDFPNTYTNYWLTKDGRKILIEWSNTAIASETGDVDLVIATGIDITKRSAAEKEIEKHINALEDTVSTRTAELVSANKKLEALAHLDSLTGIFNRRHFDAVLEKEIERGKRSSQPLTLLLCDIDYFKNYNDAYGHVAGDNCLISVAKILNDFFNRAADLVARYGGEEFVAILPGIDPEEALQIANNLVTEVCNNQLPYASSPIADYVTISAGVATFQPDELSDRASIIEATDKALYQAKEGGRNSAQQYLELIKDK